MTDFSPTKYIEKNVKLQYRNFDTDQWYTVTVIKIYGHNENIFLGKFVYCDIKFNSGEIYNHFIFTDKEFESTSDNAWKFARPWSASINEIRKLNQIVNTTSFDYYNSTINNHFSDIDSRYKRNNEIEEYEGDDEGEEWEVDEEEYNEEKEEEEDEWEAEWEEWKEGEECEDGEECEGEECEGDEDGEEGEEGEECEDDEDGEECEGDGEECEGDEECEGGEECEGDGEECEDDEDDDDCEDVDDECEDDEDDEECEDVGNETTIVIHLYPRLWSTILISTVVSTLATTLIIYASNTACSIY